MNYQRSETQKSQAQMMEDVHWLVNLLTEEIPNRKKEIKRMLDELAKIQLLETKVVELTQTIKEKDASLEELEAERQVQETISTELQQNLNNLVSELEHERTKFRDETNRFIQERDRLTEELVTLQDEIKRRDQALAEVSGIRKVLQAIYRRLRGRSDDSSIST